MDGSIKISVGASGYSLSANILNGDNSRNKDKCCSLLSENFCGVYHDHLFNFRIDMEVDEIQNSFYKGQLVKEQEQEQEE